MIVLKNISYHQASIWHVKKVISYMKSIKQDDKEYGCFKVLKKLPILESKTDVFREDNKNEPIGIGETILVEKPKKD